MQLDLIHKFENNSKNNLFVIWLSGQELTLNDTLRLEVSWWILTSERLHAWLLWAGIITLIDDQWWHLRSLTRRLAVSPMAYKTKYIFTLRSKHDRKPSHCIHKEFVFLRLHEQCYIPPIRLILHLMKLKVFKRLKNKIMATMALKILIFMLSIAGFALSFFPILTHVRLFWKISWFSPN